MSTGLRTINPNLWGKPEFMRATPVARELWIGLITACADDEGRFIADILAISQRLFPRSYPVDDAAVRDALRYWCEVGWLLLYGDEGSEDQATYGFLMGWFEHQYIKNPESSSVPEPQVLLASWSDVDAAKKWHQAEFNSGPNVHFKTVVRDFAAEARKDRKLTAKRVRSKYALSTNHVHSEGKGREGKGKGKGTRATEAPHGGNSPANGNTTPLTAAVFAYFGDADPDAQRWATALARQLSLPGCPVTEAQVIACLTDGTAGPTGPEVNFADRFIARLARQTATDTAPQPTTDADAEAIAKHEATIAILNKQRNAEIQAQVAAIKARQEAASAH